MSKVNRVFLCGNLSAQPKLITTDSGILIASCSLATNEKSKDSSGTTTEFVEWHNLVAFGKVASLMNQYLKKGSKVNVWGHLKTRQYIDKDSNNRFITEVVVDEVYFLDKLPVVN